MDGEENPGPLESGQQALHANQEHLDALKTYVQKLEVELETLDRLVETVDSVDESDLDVGGSVLIPGSIRATAPVTPKELLSPESPFHEDALKRTRYQSVSEVHPMKPRELEALSEAVRAESYRKHALDVQKRGLETFLDIDVPTLGRDAEDINWDRIAEKVSTISMTARTAKECEIRWLGEQHPEFNHDPWSKEEVSNVKSLAAEFTDDQPDWVDIAKRLGTRRTPLDCMRHAIPRKIHLWTKDADERLIKAIRMYGHDNWHLVARYVSEDATTSQCSNRFEKVLDQCIKHMAWSGEEDARLRAAVTAYGSSWVDVANNIPGRHNDQCRDRWTEQTNPDINKSHWTAEEDKLLLQYVREQENPSWKEISQRLHTGRTEAMCCNRYTVLQKGADTQAVLVTPSATQTPIAFVDWTPELPGSKQSRSNTFRFKPSFPNVSSCSATPTPPPTENPSQFVFLEPVVSANPEHHKYHKPQPPQPSVTFGTPSSTNATMPPAKKRKTRSRPATAKTAQTDDQQGECAA